MTDVSVERTPIPGLLVVRLDVRADDRGWFVEAWQRAKMTALGLPDFGPVQANIALNTARGTTRGMHAEPWDKLVTVASGGAFGAWVDLREGATFGTTYAVDLAPGVAVFVPRGVGNGYQTLVDDTSYTYLVNDHWRPDATYLAVDVADRALAIAWPVPPAERAMSERDRAAPPLADVTPVALPTTLVLGADGQLGRALLEAHPGARGVTRQELDLGDLDALEGWPWSEHDVVLNAAGYTAVDLAETSEGRRTAWAVNAEGPAALARLATRHGITLVTTRPTTSTTARVTCTTRTNPCRRSVSTASPRRRATWRSRRLLGTTCCGPRGSSVTVPTSCAPWRAWPTRVRARRWSPTRWAG
jgi:dTDP-4-dehydrorhamnose 3,5-epimerase-like enzyme